MQNDILLFTHIPKTAGTSLDWILLDIARHRNIPHYRARGAIYGQGENAHKAMFAFARLPEEFLSKPAIITGHFPYGAHRLLKIAHSYITLLRHPASLLLSTYHFGISRGRWKEDYPIEKALREGLIADNIQTRMLAGARTSSIPCGSKMYNQALSNLRFEYAAFGITEMFDDTMKLLTAKFSWPRIEYIRRQVSSRRPDQQEMMQAQNLAVQYFRYDFELYDEAKSLFETRLNQFNAKITNTEQSLA
jgi:hypothetical protein